MRLLYMACEYNLKAYLYFVSFTLLVAWFQFLMVSKLWTLRREKCSLIVYCLFLKLLDVGVTLIYIKIDTKSIYTFMVNLNGKLEIYCPECEHKIQIELAIFYFIVKSKTHFRTTPLHSTWFFFFFENSTFYKERIIIFEEVRPKYI